MGNAVFADCSALETVKLPNQATEIVDSMFYNCESLVEMNIPTSVIRIGASAFNMCKAYNNCELPSTLKAIGELAFCKSGIIGMTLPKSIESLGNRIFLSCTNLTNITFDKNLLLMTLPDNIFDGCSNLTSFTLPSSLATIGSGAFKGCSSLTQVILEQSNIQTISAYAFSGCSNLKEITLPTTIESFGANAFNSCDRINVITINNPEPPSAASSTFSNTTISNASLYVVDESKYKANAYWAQFNIMKESTLTYMVDGIEYGEVQTLNMGTPIEAKDIKDHPNYGKRNFSGWKNLPELMPNDDVVVTGSFEYKLTYKDADTEDELTSVSLFYGGEVVETAELTKQGYRYVIDDNVETMPAEDYTILVKYYKTETDWDFDGLTYHIYTEGDDPHAELILCKSKNTDIIEVPSAVTYMNDSYIVTAIRTDAFKGCNEMTSVTLPGTIKSIGTQAFANCYKLTEITIPESVETLGLEVFLRCTGLKKFFFKDGSKIQILPAYTFSSCEVLETVELYSTLTTISNDAFRGCSSLKEIAIPENVTSIGDYVFLGCKKLEKVTIDNETVLPNASENTFEEDTYDKATLYVSGTLQSNLTSPWNKFDNVDLGGEITAQKCATPKIIYNKGTLTFECDTPDAEIKSEITVSDAIKTEGANTQTLNKTYIIKAYATADGYKRSDPAMATITWQDGKLCDTTGFDGDVVHEDV